MRPSLELPGHLRLRHPLLHGTVTSIHEKIDTRHVRGGIGRQEQIGTLELLGLALAAVHMVSTSAAGKILSNGAGCVCQTGNSPHRYLVSPSALGRSRDEVGNLGVDVAWRDGIGPGEANPLDGEGFAYTPESAADRRGQCLSHIGSWAAGVEVTYRRE